MGFSSDPSGDPSPPLRTTSFSPLIFIRRFSSEIDAVPLERSLTLHQVTAKAILIRVEVEETHPIALQGQPIKVLPSRIMFVVARPPKPLRFHVCTRDFNPISRIAGEKRSAFDSSPFFSAENLDLLREALFASCSPPSPTPFCQPLAAPVVGREPH